MRILIAGAGKLGYKLAEAFSNQENSITVIDINEQALQRVHTNLDVLAVKGSAVQVELLQQASVKNADLFAAVTSSDEVNIVAAQLAKKLGCRQAAARVRNPEYAKQLDFLRTEMDIDYIVNPELETARYIAKYLLKGTLVYVESFADGRVGMLDFPVKNIPEWVGKKLREIGSFDAVLVAAVAREGEMIIPHGETSLMDGDTVYLFGKRDALQRFAASHFPPRDKRMAKSVMILGGGRSGYYLASRLRQNGAAVKIIERDEAQCQYLVENLPDVLVIHGDATDSDLLREENFAHMDALVTLTGSDEENLLLALLGKRQGIPMVVAKISRPNFIPIIEQLGVGRAVNPVLISAGEIIRFSQGGQVASLSLLLDGQAEVMEIVADEQTAVIGRSLSELGLPKGIIIGAIARGSDVIIPDGSAVIQPKDRVIVFCLNKDIPVLEQLFYRRKGGFSRGLWPGPKDSGKYTQD
ncbi:MAG: Trk system potassium transporter TrkA [Limnochordia bacterium]|jgi:trk system potassium uptake protein TrkA|nr:Trk system potassium transporter TrkA [Bacillota bacterium]NLH31901.1 Trk system potassium transporter TrkA [Bacillota bacterium]HXK96320.1 Trk system potassium transporter TrkA [Limnochordia bacterium]